MLFLSIHIYCSVEYFCGRTGHQNLIVLRLVFDSECASVHDDVGLAFATSGESCGYGRGARSCSTGLCNTGASFPYTHPDIPVG